jgi:hypothetical protein
VQESRSCGTQPTLGIREGFLEEGVSELVLGEKNYADQGLGVWLSGTVLT